MHHRGAGRADDHPGCSVPRVPPSGNAAAPDGDLMGGTLAFVQLAQSASPLGTTARDSRQGNEGEGTGSGSKSWVATGRRGTPFAPGRPAATVSRSALQSPLNSTDSACVACSHPRSIGELSSRVGRSWIASSIGIVSCGSGRNYGRRPVLCRGGQPHTVIRHPTALPRVAPRSVACWPNGPTPSDQLIRGRQLHRIRTVDVTPSGPPSRDVVHPSHPRSDTMSIPGLGVPSGTPEPFTEHWQQDASAAMQG